MPAGKTWLLRLPEIRRELEALDVPVIDRAAFERIFGVRRRRAIQLMQYFDGYQAGRTCLVNRMSLLSEVEKLEASSEYVLERRRRERVTAALEKIRQYRVAATVV